MARKLVFIVGVLALASCTPITPEPFPTAILITSEPLSTIVPTELPPPTVTLYPTATPEGWELTVTPTQIVLENMPEVLILVVIDPEFTDGVLIRSGPGYDCDTYDPWCNWAESIFPSNDLDVADMFALIEVDTTHDIAWCEYVSNFSLGTNWSACAYLRPATEEDCVEAERLEMSEYLSPCEG